MSVVTRLPTVPQTGDIIGAYIPAHYNKGKPGPDLRLCVVLGLEVGESDNRLKGLWLVRLSERTDKVRSWDYYLPQEQMKALGDDRLQRDYVIRTPRIDLLPATTEYVGYMPVLGHLRPNAWGGLLQQMRFGQASPFCENTYGPRAQLPDTVVKTRMGSEDCYLSFDYETIIDHVSLPDMCGNHAVPADNYGRAVKQQDRQERAISRLIHEDFKNARIDSAESFEEYVQTVLAPRVMAIRSGQNAGPKPAP